MLIKIIATKFALISFCKHFVEIDRKFVFGDNNSNNIFLNKLYINILNVLIIIYMYNNIYQ